MDEANKNQLLAVVGPTASGKTRLLSNSRCRRSGEVVSCDSMQIYRGMEIGTAKPTPARWLASHTICSVFSSPRRPSAPPIIRSSPPGRSRDRIARAYTAARQRHRLLCPRCCAAHPLSRGECRGGARLVTTRMRGRHRAALRAPADVDPEAAAQIPNQHERVIRALEYCTDRRPVFRAGKGLPNAASPLRLQDALPLLPRPRGTVRAHQPPRRSDARGRASRGGAPVSSSAAQAPAPRRRPSATRAAPVF